MTDQFPIVSIKPEWVLSQEEMGSKSKFWLRREDRADSDWLFKYPQQNTGQHWAEKIAAEVAALLQVRHSEVELAKFEEKRGSITRSFVSENVSLDHGNQLLKTYLSGYHDAERFRQSSHTFSRIWQTLDEIFKQEHLIASAKLEFASYLVLDAVIGNTDRHHENWGVLRRSGQGGSQIDLAPSFDHASSLGRELLDDRRNRYLAENEVGRYAERGRGGIYWSQDDRWGPSPLTLVRKGTDRCRDQFLPGLQKLSALNMDSLTAIVDRIPDHWMSPPARSFAVELMRYNIKQLEELLQ